MGGFLCRYSRAALLVTAILHAGCDYQLMTAPGVGPLPNGVAPPLVPMSGYLYNAASFYAPVPGATVELRGAVTVSAITEADGRFSLDVPTGSLQLRIYKEGYRTYEASVVVSHELVRDFTLAPMFDPSDVEGIYDLWIDVADECRRSGFPIELWTRRYSAAIEQDHFAIDVKLGGASFELSYDGSLGDRFTGRVEPDGVAFLLNPWNLWAEIPPTLVERVGPNYLLIGGRAVAGLPLGVSPGTFSGTVALFATSPWSWVEPVTLAECTSDDHSFALTR